MSKQGPPWCVLIWEGTILYAVAGPFKNRLEATAWCDARGPEKRDVVPLWPPGEVEETQSAGQTG